MTRVAILGAGSIAYGLAAMLAQAGHEATMWSPSGAISGSIQLSSVGAITGTFQVRAAFSAADAVADAECVIVAVPGFGHRAVMDAVAGHLQAGQGVIISSHCSFSALYLSRLLAARGIELPTAALGSTVLSGRKTGPASVRVTNVRQRLDVSTIPQRLADAGLRQCVTLFGDRFQDRPDVLAIALSNLNPQNHMAMALCNFTRIESGEVWGNYAGITRSVGRLIEALDGERLAIAARLGVDVRSVQDHFHLSFAIPRASIAEMAATIHSRGDAPNGPATAETRYVLEDVPFGLVPIELLGRLAGVPTPLHTAGIGLFSAMYDTDFRTANDIIPSLQLDQLSPAALQFLCREGYRGSATTNG
jgi:opine dehydrogenase